jgi:hypothetical protein
MRQTKEAK